MTRPWILWASWLGILTAVSGILHWYIWSRLVRDTDLPRGCRRICAWVFSGITLLIPFSLFFRRVLADPAGTMLYLGLVTWLAILFFLVSIRILGEGVSAGLWVRSVWVQQKPFDPSRRKFLSRALATGTLAVGVPCLVKGAVNAFEDPDIKEVAVRMDRLPDRARGLTIAQLTDLHIAPWTSERFVARLVERTNSIRADLTVITGDLVDGDLHQIGPQLSALEKLSARLGIFFVTGNHEYYVGSEPILQLLPKLGIVNLHNRGVVLDDALYLCGIPDRAIRRNPFVTDADLPNVVRSLEGRDPDRPAILLAHQPREIAAAESAGIDLQLSGHTHGGQIWPFGGIVMAAQPYLRGLHRHGKTQIYVSSGAGTWGPPIRIGAPAEISKIVLT